MKSVTLCGSRRFTPEIREFAKELQSLGVLVYEPYLHSGAEEWERLSEQYKKFVLLGLTHDHFYKLRLGDVVYIYNQDDYIGSSTTLELGFAIALGKPIYSYSDIDPELCRQVLLRTAVTTPVALLPFLQ